MTHHIFKAIVVDDETAAVTKLEKELAAFPEIRILSSFTNPEEAVGEILKLNPDVVFLDVQMPGMSGFDVMESLDKAAVHPFIVFVTAFDQYAIDAIRHAAFDYLLKPVGGDDLRRVISRLMISSAEADSVKMFRTLLESISPNKRFKIPTMGGFLMVNTADIVYIEADWNYADLIFADEKKQMISINLGTLMKTLPEKDFCRISRSLIINLNYLARVNRLKRKVILAKDGKEYILPIPALNIRKLDAKLE